MQSMGFLNVQRKHCWGDFTMSRVGLIFLSGEILLLLAQKFFHPLGWHKLLAATNIHLSPAKIFKKFFIQLYNTCCWRICLVSTYQLVLSWKQICLKDFWIITYSRSGNSTYPPIQHITYLVNSRTRTILFGLHWGHCHPQIKLSDMFPKILYLLVCAQVQVFEILWQFENMWIHSMLMVPSQFDNCKHCNKNKQNQ